MKTSFYRRPRFIVTTAVALYGIALAITWIGGTRNAQTRMREILKAAEKGYSNVIYGEVEAVLRFTAGSVLRDLNGRCASYSVDRMQALANRFNLSEINLVARNAEIVASNLEPLLGADFSENAYTREFLALTNRTVSFVVQPFRHGIRNPEAFCMYYGLPFPERDGLVQIGMSFDSIRDTMYSWTREESEKALREWHFSVEGWYIRADDRSDFKRGELFREEREGKTVVGLWFDFYGYPYAAVIPEAFCFKQRNVMFVITALILGVLLSLFSLFLVLLSRASTKLEAFHAAAAARTAADLAIARTIQMSALPSTVGAFLDFLEFSLEAECRPAREVGGDFYDFYPLSGGRLAFLIADASGKGIPAAMFMMEAKTVLRNSLVEFSDLAAAVAAANARLCEQNEAEMFLTAWVGALDPKTGVMEYVNAGHNRPFVRHADGTIDKVAGKNGLFLGMFDQADYQSHFLFLKKGDRLLLYTDGITEAMNARKELFGEARLREALSAKRVQEALREFVGEAEQSDDITALAIDWNGRPQPAERVFPCRETSQAESLTFLRAALADVAPAPRARLLNGADEIIANIIGYSGSKDFSVAVEKVAGRVRLTLADAGRAYNPLSHEDPDTQAPIEAREIGGLGLVMVKKLVDRLTYARQGERNVLTLICRF